MESPLNIEAQLFVEDVSEALSFATEIINQLPEKDPRKVRFSDELNQRVQELITLHQADSQALFDPQSEECEDKNRERSTVLLNGDGHIIEQMRVLRGFYAGKVWESVISQVSRLLEEDQKAELKQLNNTEAFDSSFVEYKSNLKSCKQAYENNVNAVSAMYSEQQQMISKAKTMTTDLNNFQQNKKKMAEELDQMAVDAANRSDQLLIDIAELKKTVSDKQAEATQSGFKCKVVIQPRKRNEKLLTLQQTVQQINDIWVCKQKHDLSCTQRGKPMDSLRFYLYNYYALKYGQTQMSKSLQVKSLLYSAGYYSSQNAICAIFAAESQLQVDEAYKLNVLKLEKQVDELSGEQNKTLKQILEIFQIKNEAAEQILTKCGENKQEFKNQLNLYDLRNHINCLQKFRFQWGKLDLKKIGQISVQQYRELCKTLGEQSIDECVQGACRGLQVVGFTNGVLALGQVIFGGVE